MGKDKNGGFLAPKSIANRIKAKGLQKLRWWCQMCNKQCRDENGFKCHITSESHLRQMQIFSENSTKIMDEFSKEFEDGMMEIIKRKARHQRQNANQLYRDYIAYKEHFHMNATIWETLTDFVMYLGRTGKCEVDETEKGWFVTYIDRDPETLAKIEARAKREVGRHTTPTQRPRPPPCVPPPRPHPPPPAAAPTSQRSELDSEEKHQRDIQRQVKAARHEAEAAAPTSTELQRDDPSAKISLGLGAALSSGKAKAPPAASAASAAFFSEDAADAGGAAAAGSGGAGGKRPMSQVEALMLQEKARKEREARKEEEARASEAAAAAAAAASSSGGGGRKDYWLRRGLIVKVVNKKLGGGKYYKLKGEVEKVVDRYTGHVRIVTTGDLLRLDQDDVETVIPAVGGRVMVVNGRCVGDVGELLSLDTEGFCVAVRIDGGEHDGRVLDRVEYEDVCKVASGV